MRSRGSLAVVAVAATVALWGCASRTTKAPSGAVRVEVAKVGLDSAGIPFVLLQETGASVSCKS